MPADSYVVDADGHLCEPARLWEDNLPQRFLKFPSRTRPIERLRRRQRSLGHLLPPFLGMLQNLNDYVTREREFYQKTGRLK